MRHNSPPGLFEAFLNERADQFEPKTVKLNEFTDMPARMPETADSALPEKIFKMRENTAHQDCASC